MSDSPSKLLVVLPTMWDRKQFDSCRDQWEGRFEIEYAEPSDADCPSDFDALGYIRAMAERNDYAGVFSSSDYPGATVAAAIAHARGLVGPDPKLVLEGSHKLASRQTQLACVRDATPGFCLVDPDELDEPPAVGFPCFVKPIKGAFSMFAKKVDSLEELRAHLDRPAVRSFRFDFLDIFNDLWKHYARSNIDGSFFIAEELLTGLQVTVDGFVMDDEPVVLGIVDSEFHAGTGSFSRFVYPSALPPNVQQEMHDVASRCIKGMGLRHCFFNIEMIWDGDNRVSIIEVNPRVCGQFGDLYAKVDGRNCYSVVPELKCGHPVSWPRAEGRFRIAASVPLRVFEPCRVGAAPDATCIADIEARYPGTLIWNEVALGEVLSDFAHEDGASFRYAVINLGADSHEELIAKCEEISRDLSYRFDSLQ